MKRTSAFVSTICLLCLLSTVSISEGAPTVEVSQLSPDWLPRASGCAEKGVECKRRNELRDYKLGFVNE